MVKKQNFAIWIQIAYIKTDDIYKDIGDVEIRFDTANYESECNFIDRLLRKEKNDKEIELMKDELRGKEMTGLVGARAKACNYLIDDGSEVKIAKDTKKGVIKTKLKFENYENCLEVTHLDNKTNYWAENKTDMDSIKENHKEFIKK